MIDFNALVEKSRKSRSENDIINTSISHALILFENLIKSAIDRNKPIAIICGCMQERFYDDLIGDMQLAMDSGIKIKALFLDDIDFSRNKCAIAIRAHENGLIKRANPPSPHYILVGNDSYRLELNDKTKEAVANFNNDVVGTALEKNFIDSFAAAN